MVCCGIWEKFDQGNNLINEYKFWNLYVNNKPFKFGQCVAILKRHADKLSDITKEELTEYCMLVKDIEAALTKAFGCYLVHHMLLMFYDKHVHFHIVPRYKKSISFAGINWEDDQIADPIPQKPIELSSKQITEIKNKITSAL